MVPTLGRNAEARLAAKPGMHDAELYDRQGSDPVYEEWFADSGWPWMAIGATSVPG